MNISSHKNNKQAFSLVELSIVMIIISLLIVGFIAGAKLIGQAQKHKLTSIANAIDQADGGFEVKFLQTAGDFIKPLLS